jgi:hypothetical protein
MFWQAEKGKNNKNKYKVNKIRGLMMRTEEGGVEEPQPT